MTPGADPTTRPTRPRRRRAAGALAVSLAAVLGAAGCAGDDEGAEVRGATTVDGAAPSEGIEDVDAEARAAAVEFFEAHATLDHDRALGRASGAAALAVQWARDVNGVPEVPGGPYEARATPPPTARVAISDVTESPDGRLRASGHVELDHCPPALAPGELPDPEVGPDGAPTTTPPVPTTWFATDLVFTRDGDRLLVDDFRMDDSPHPVSQLFSVPPTEDAVVVLDEDPASDGAQPAAVARTLAGELGVRAAHRDLDGTVQYLLAVPELPDLTLAAAELLSPVGAGALPPGPEADGEALELLGPRPDDAAGAPLVLLVDDDGFPGGPGILQLTFTGTQEGRLVVADLAVGDLPPLSEEPTNAVRALVAAATSTTTTSSTLPPTSLVPVPVPVPVPGPSPTTPDTPAPPAPVRPAPTAPPTTAPRPPAPPSTTTTTSTTVP